MSWIDQIKLGIKITTGDGQVYTPDYTNPIKTTPFNISEFEFPEVRGTKVYRGTPKGTRHEIELYFQGANNIEDARRFETSNFDNRPWKIEHPIHGVLAVQPISLTYDFTGLNVCKITGTIVETIEQDYPQVSTNVVDKTIETVQKSLDANIESFGETQLSTSNKTKLLDNMKKSFDAVKGKIKVGLNEYQDVFSRANGAVNTVSGNATIAITGATGLLTYPYQFQDNIKNKLSMFGAQLDKLNLTVGSLVNPTDKKVYENNAGGSILGMVLSLANPFTATNQLLPGDLATADDVFDVIDTLTGAYNTYIDNLNTLQSPTGSELDSYLPDPATILNMSSAVDLITSQLFNLAVNSKQKRSIVLNYPSNIIVLTHRFYGLKPDDSTITEFMNANNFSIDELIQIPANRTITYYV